MLKDLNTEIDALMTAMTIAKEEGDEITAASYEKSLIELIGTSKDRIDSATYYIKAREKEVELYKEEIERLQARIRAIENRKEYIKTIMYIILKKLNLRKLLGNFERGFFLKNYYSVNVLNIDKLDQKYLRRKEIIEADKKALLEDLKQGLAIDGAELKETEHIQLK